MSKLWKLPQKDACRARDQKCNICHKIGHFSKVCQRREQGAVKVKHKKDLYKNRNPVDLEVKKYMKLKMIICI